VEVKRLQRQEVCLSPRHSTFWVRIQLLQIQIRLSVLRQALDRMGSWGSVNQRAKPLCQVHPVNPSSRRRRTIWGQASVASTSRQRRAAQGATPLQTRLHPHSASQLKVHPTLSLASQLKVHPTPSSANLQNPPDLPCLLKRKGAIRHLTAHLKSQTSRHSLHLQRLRKIHQHFPHSLLQRQRLRRPKHPALHLRRSRSLRKARSSKTRRQAFCPRRQQQQLHSRLRARHFHLHRNPRARHHSVSHQAKTRQQHQHGEDLYRRISTDPQNLVHWPSHTLLASTRLIPSNRHSTQLRRLKTSTRHQFQARKSRSLNPAQRSTSQLSQNQTLLHSFATLPAT
jgi:hypothetical protein